MTHLTPPSIQVVATPGDLARAAADRVAATLVHNPASVIALPTGSTPLGLFAELVQRVNAGTLDFSRTRFFCLDEYLGVSPDDPDSLTGWLFREFFDPAGVRRDQVTLVPAAAADPTPAAVEYEAALAAAGGLDLVILGIGPNGHIAFNEPGSALDSRTRVLDLSAGSRAQAAAYWDARFTPPTRAMTMGVATLLAARAIVLIATGAAKREIVTAALNGPIGAAVPASWLRTVPDRVTFIVDWAAAPAT